jgi:NAD(P)-dependent dehydrogenase (short-subunit alcohol dehydrogenase family)
MGMALCRRFGREGYHVAMIARDDRRLGEALRTLQAEGISASAHTADVTDRKAVATAFQRIGQDLGAPEVLIFNAFLRQSCAPSLLTELDVMDSIKVNVIGALHCVRQVVADMRYKRRGTILFTGGGSAVEPPVQVAALGLGKAALRNLCFSLARELHYHDIHVATVTIFDHINPGTHFDPDKIAEAYWQLHVQPQDEWQREIEYR